MLEYLALALGFIATLVGVIGKASNDGAKFPKNITILGWSAIITAVISLSTSIVLKSIAESDKNRKEFWALRELEFATYKMLSPYLEITDPPELKDRYHLSETFCKSKIFDGYVNINLKDSVRSLFGYITYGQLSTQRTKEACDQMGNIIASYSNFLPSDIVELVSEIRTDPWTEIMLNAHSKELLSRSKDTCYFYPRSKLGVKLVPKEKYIEKINSFAITIQKLESKIGTNSIELAQKLNIENLPPAFFAPLAR